jgi:hypothetical protein
VDQDSVGVRQPHLLSAARRQSGNARAVGSVLNIAGVVVISVKSRFRELSSTVFVAASLAADTRERTGHIFVLAYSPVKTVAEPWP